MSRPTAKPLQRTPRAPLLAPAAEPAAEPRAAEGVLEDAEDAEDAGLPPQGQPEASPAALQEAGAAAQEKFLSVRVPKDLHRRVRTASLDHDLAVRQIVISAVIAWLDENDKR